MPVARTRVVVEGEVQALGYRYYIARIAHRLHVTGRVANLVDGRVEVIAEGDEDNLRAFLKALDIKKLPICVTRMRVRQQAPTDEFRGFRIVPGVLVNEMVEGFSTWAAICHAWLYK